MTEILDRLTALPPKAGQENAGAGHNTNQRPQLGEEEIMVRRETAAHAVRHDNRGNRLLCAHGRRSTGLRDTLRAMKRVDQSFGT